MDTRLNLAILGGFSNGMWYKTRLSTTEKQHLLETSLPAEL
jgi:hypothetical protein